MPFRIDLDAAPDDALDRLIELGAFDVGTTIGGRIAAILPDDVTRERVADALGLTADAVRMSAAPGRDDGSVWVLTPGPVQVGRLRIVPAEEPENEGVLRLADSAAFGTGLHPSTALCLEALQDELGAGLPASVLDIGTGTGVLAIAALVSGVPLATAIDLDAEAVTAAAANAALNGVRGRLQIVQGGPDVLAGRWPLVMANILAAPLVDLAPAITRLIESRGTLVLSGMRVSLASEVARAYRHRGMHAITERTHAGWSALTLRASW